MPRDYTTYSTAELARRFGLYARAFDTADPAARPASIDWLEALATVLDLIETELARRGITLCPSCGNLPGQHTRRCPGQTKTVDLPGCDPNARQEGRQHGNDDPHQGPPD